MKNNLLLLYDRMSVAERSQLVKVIAGLWDSIPDRTKKQYLEIPGFVEAVKKELEAS